MFLFEPCQLNSVIFMGLSFHISISVWFPTQNFSTKWLAVFCGISKTFVKIMISAQKYGGRWFYVSILLKHFTWMNAQVEIWFMMNQISTCATVGSKIVCLFFFFIRNNIQRTIQINSITKKSLRCLYIPEANSHMGKQVPFGLSVFMHLMLKSW